MKAPVAVLIVFACFLLGSINGFVVDQVHTAWTGNLNERIISFVTPIVESDILTTAQYGTSETNLSFTATGNHSKFGTHGHVFLIHNVLLSNLDLDQKYYYRVGDGISSTWSSVFSFVTKTGSITYAVYGDFGDSNDESLDRLIQEVEKDEYQAVLHVGDFAYDFDTDSGKVGDAFMNDIMPIAATVPYMTCPGNHEHKFNFTHYINRFSLVAEGVGKNSGSDVNLWYSFNMENVHFIAIDTEVYHYFRDEGQIQRQLNWIEQDLKEANMNRDKYPWIIMYGHKGWWMDSTNYTGFEELCHKYGVDLFLCGHVHNYERMFPYYQGQIDTQPVPHVYTNPKYMTTIVSGSPGCKEKISHDTGPTDALAADMKAYGFGHMKIFNSTHLYWDWRVASSGKVHDHMWLIQENHRMRI